MDAFTMVITGKEHVLGFPNPGLRWLDHIILIIDQLHGHHPNGYSSHLLMAMSASFTEGTGEDNSGLTCDDWRDVG